MTGKLLSLSRARKSRARAEKAHKATANAAKFGRSKSERAQDAAEAKRAQRHLDDHKTDPTST